MSARGAAASRGIRDALALLVPVALIGLLALDEGGLALDLRQQMWVVVWWALALGLAFGLAPRTQPPPGLWTAAGGVLALGLVQALSVSWGPSDDRALADACRTFGYLGLLALAWAWLGPHSWRRAALGLFAVAVAVPAYAVIGRLTGFEDALGAGRLAEPLGYWNALAGWSAATLAMALAWSADGRARDVRALAAAMLPVAGTALYLTYSRGGVLAAVVGLGVVIALTRNRRRAGLHALAGAAGTALCVLVVRSQPQIADGSGTDGALSVGIAIVVATVACWQFARTISVGRRGVPGPWTPSARLLAAGVAALAIGLVAVAFVAGRDGFGRGGDAGRLDDTDPSARLTTAAGDRSGYWSEALGGFADEPVHGEGAGSFGYRWAAAADGRALVSDPHSLLFSTASELGLLGLLALGVAGAGVAILVARGVAAGRRAPPAVALAAGFAVFVTTTAFDWTWESTAFAAFGVACAGVLSMAAARPIPRRPDEARSRALDSKARWALFALALAMGALQIPGAVSYSLIGESERELAFGRPQDAHSTADRAVTAAPWSGAAYAARAEASLAEQELQAARTDALEAIDREPLEARHWVLLGRIDAARDDLPAVVDAFGEAVRLNPQEAQLGSREVAAIARRLGRAGYDEDDVLGTAATG